MLRLYCQVFLVALIFLCKFILGLPDKRPPLGKLLDKIVYLCLESLRGDNFSFSIRGCDDIPILDQNLHESVGEIIVGLDPILDGPALGVEHSFDQEHVGDGVANSLEDKLCF